MAVRIGKIDLVGLQKINTADTRNLVQQRGPGQQGSVFQDLGREPVTLILEGLLLSDDTQGALEELRQAQQKAKPLPFAADVIAGADLTDVLIEDLRVHQLAGYRDRFWFYLKVKEHKEPPEPAGAGLVPVTLDLESLADEWGLSGPLAVLSKIDPASIMKVLQAVPSVIQHLSAGDIRGLLSDVQNLGGLDALGDVLRTVSGLDPALIKDLIEEGKDLVEGAQDLIQSAMDVVDAISGGAEFFDRLKDVVDKAERVGEALLEYKPEDAFKPLAALTEAQE